MASISGARKKGVFVSRKWVIVVLALLGACALFFVVRPRLITMLESSLPPDVGMEGTLSTDAPRAIVVVDPTVYDEIANASTARMQDLLAQGQIVLVPRGTRVRVRSSDDSRVQIEVLEGDYRGRVGYVPLGTIQR
jgi:hypothetical protein